MVISEVQDLPANDVFAAYYIVYRDDVNVRDPQYAQPLAVIYVGRDGTFSLFKTSRRDSIHNTLTSALAAI